MMRSLTCALLVLLAAADAGAAWREVADGVRYQRFRSKNSEIHVARVDLRAKVQVIATPEADRGTVVSDFAARRGALVAVNADFFDPQRKPIGLSVGACGPWESARDNGRQAVVAFGVQRVEIFPERDITSAEEWMTAAVGGFPVLVRGCRALGASELPGPDRFTRAPHPRTAVGFSRDRKTMYLVVVDGRRPGVPGLTLAELAAWMRKRLRVCSALNLDGGGSSAMWVQNTIVNQPSDGVERPVANHLAVIPAGTGVACDQASGPK